MAKTTAVLVTGASSGIGRKLVERLAARNHFVYACARKDSDLSSLASLANVQAVRLDVTSSQDIAASVKTIIESGRGLHGLVNNAGIVSLGPVVDGDEAEFDLVMRVNVYGVYHLTKALAPLLIAERGRIVMVSSVAGILADKNVGAYSMSKHAIEAFTDSLALELEPFGVHVSVVEPGTFHTQIGRNAQARVGHNSLLPDFSRFKEPAEVVAAIELALFELRPKRRYLVVPNEDEARLTIKKQIMQLVQLNEEHSYTYDRSVLIRMLDEALAQARPHSAALLAPAARVQPGRVSAGEP